MNLIRECLLLLWNFLRPSPTETYGISLPYELEREIFEIAISSFPGCVPCVVLVARRFHQWFNHDLYRIVVFTSTRISPPALHSSLSKHACLSNVNPEHLAAHGHLVRHAHFAGYRTATPVALILSHCPNIETIVLRDIRRLRSLKTISPVLEHIAKRGKLKRLTFFPEFFSSIVPFTSPCVSLTHLVLVDCPRGIPSHQIDLVPQLTHLAIIASIPPNEFMADILRRCKQLRLLVIVTNTFWPLDISRSVELQDSRVVILTGDPSRNLFFPLKISAFLSEQWRRSLKGEADFWSVAEEAKAKDMKVSFCSNDYNLLYIRDTFFSVLCEHLQR